MSSTFSEFPVGKANGVCIIDPGIKRPELECFNALAALVAGPVSYHLPALFGMESIYRLASAPRATIVLGSASSVHDGFPWQVDLGDWLKKQWERKMPTLGICFGHQLIAHLGGGAVEFRLESHEKREGYFKVRVHETKASIPTQGWVYESHREIVTRAPERFDILASSDDVAIEGLRHQTLPIWSFQGHVEAVPGFSKVESAKSPSFEETSFFGRKWIDYFLKNIR